MDKKKMKEVSKMMKSQKFEDALGKIDVLLISDPQHLKLSLLRIKCLIQLGRLDQALQCANDLSHEHFDNVYIM